MATILILSPNGKGISLALKLAYEGHVVKVFQKNQTVKRTLANFKNPSLVSSPRVNIDQYDLVLADEIGFGSECDELANKGKLVFGGSFNYKLELDNEYKKRVVKTLLDIPYHKDEEGCLVQTEGWFNGEEFIKPFNHSFKQKRLLEGDKGPITESSGVVLYPSAEDKLISKVLEPLSALLRKVNYLGPISVETVIHNKDIYFKDFKAGFNYDSIQAWVELLKIPFFDFLYRIALKKGDFVERVDYIDTLGIAVRLSISPYPYKEGVSFRTKGLIDVPDEALKHVWLSQINGVVCCCTAKGDTIGECQRRVYRTVRNVIIDKDVQYRSDIGNDFKECKEAIDRWCE